MSYWGHFDILVSIWPVTGKWLANRAKQSEIWDTWVFVTCDIWHNCLKMACNSFLVSDYAREWTLWNFNIILNKERSLNLKHSNMAIKHNNDVTWQAVKHHKQSDKAHGPLVFLKMWFAFFPIPQLTYVSIQDSHCTAEQYQEICASEKNLWKYFNTGYICSHCNIKQIEICFLRILVFSSYISWMAQCV